ncbi:MAG: hypothetical protein ACO3Z6_02785 [Pseudomonadales bacterium]
MSEAAAVSFETVKYTVPEPRIARILLNRPDRANAQNMQLLYELNSALDRACADDDIRCIIIAAVSISPPVMTCRVRTTCP